MTTLSEQEFRVKSDEVLQATRKALLPLADAEGFEVELQNGVPRHRFRRAERRQVRISPNAPVRQIWVSAMARSFKLSWSAETNTFELNGETLALLLDRLARTFLGK